MIPPTPAQIKAAAKVIYAVTEKLTLSDLMPVATAALTAAAEVREPQTSAEYHQRRGAAWDIIDQAIGDYDAFMLDDDYSAQDALDKIIATMKERRSFYHIGIEAQDKS